MLQWLRQRFYVQRTLSHLLLSLFFTQCAKWPLDDTAEIGDNIYGCKMTIWVDNAYFSSSISCFDIMDTYAFDLSSIYRALSLPLAFRFSSSFCEMDVTDGAIL